MVELIRRLIRQEMLRMRGTTRRAPLQGWNIRDGRPVTTHQGWTDELLDAVVAEPFGLASRPPQGTRMVLVQTRSGDLVAVAAEDTSTRPTVAEQEVVLYAPSGAIIRLKPSGDVSLQSAGGAAVDLVGSEVRLAGGTLSVARENDACTHALVAGPYTVTGTVTIGAGAPNVKA